MVQHGESTGQSSKYPPETAKILHRNIFWFFLWDEEFVSRTISDDNVDLDKFPASRVWQLAKRMERFKVTACHIKHVACDPQAAQINLLKHQDTELPTGKYKKEKSSVKSRPSNSKQHGCESFQVQSQHKKRFDVKSAHQNKDRCSKCGDSAHVEGFQCPAKSSGVMFATSLDTLPAFVTRKNKLLSNQGNQRCTSYKQVKYIPKIVSFAVNLKMTAQVKIPFVWRSKQSAHRLTFREFPGQPTSSQIWFRDWNHTTQETCIQEKELALVWMLI